MVSLLDVAPSFCVDRIMKRLQFHFVSQTFRLIRSFSSSSCMLLPRRPPTLPPTKVNQSISLDDLTLRSAQPPLYLSKTSFLVCFPSAGGEKLTAGGDAPAQRNFTS